jgi:hypothetical protein
MPNVRTVRRRRRVAPSTTVLARTPSVTGARWEVLPPNFVPRPERALNVKRCRQRSAVAPAASSSFAR